MAKIRKMDAVNVKNKKLSKKADYSKPLINIFIFYGTFLLDVV